jgi:hypothetical protein
VWKSNRYTNRLTVWVFDCDGGAIGQFITSWIQVYLALAIVLKCFSTCFAALLVTVSWYVPVRG